MSMEQKFWKEIHFVRFFMKVSNIYEKKKKKFWDGHFQNFLISAWFLQILALK